MSGYDPSLFVSQPLVPFHISPVPELVFGISLPEALKCVFKQSGKRLLIITGGASWSALGLQQEIDKALEHHASSLAYESVTGEPSPEKVTDIVTRYKHTKDAVVAIGGGSVIDTGKAVAAMLCEEKEVTRFLEGVGDSVPSGERLPFYACPTTAGTGAEATKNAVLSRTGPGGFKKSLRHDRYIPDAALIDPSLTLTLPVETVIATGLDALTQMLEAFTSAKGNPFTNELCLSGIDLAVNSLPKAVREPGNINYRYNLSLAAFYSGVALANAGLGAVHGIAGSLGGVHPVAHGLICAKLLTPVFREMHSQDNGEKIGLHNAQLKVRTGFDIHMLLEIIDELSAQLPALSSKGMTRDMIISVKDSFGNKNALVPLSPSTLFRVAVESLTR
ncbi:MAG: iron-containing alcohol dehydrogenase [Spirochaetales bacterium]|nr:iron-containing alcohol dehydrogenase [Spirochaetales bacterium]